MRRFIAGFILICILLSTGSSALTQPLQSTFRTLSPNPGPPRVIVVPGNIQLNISYTSTVCAYANGSITISATGGTPPYQFSLDGVTFQSNGRFTGLYGTRYGIVVKDALGQQNSENIDVGYVGHTTNLYVPAYISPTACAASDGSITVKGSSPQGDQSPFLYSMDGVNFHSSNTFSNLSAGNYTFYVQNTDGCIDSAYFPLFPNCGMQGVWDYSSTACNNEGYINVVSVTGGTAPYKYSLNGGAFQASANFSGLTAGLYKLRIQDATGNILLYAFPIFAGCHVTANATAIDASCNAIDGSIAVTQTGGVSPYTYSLDGTHFQSSYVFNGLAPGEYTITVKDAGGLETKAAATVHNNCPTRVTTVVSNTTCHGNNGKIKAVVVNGTGPFRYSIDGGNFQTSDLFTFVPKGTHTLTAIDANNVTMRTIATVSEEPLALPRVFALPTTCNYLDGTIIVTAAVPGPFEYSLDAVNYQSSNVFKGLWDQGYYTVYMRDQYGCVTYYTQGWVGRNCINVTAVAASSQCIGSTGKISATGSSGADPYSFSIDGTQFQASNIFENLAAGDYTVVIRGADGATNSTTVTVKASCLRLTTTQVAAHCGKKDGSILAAASNGQPPYQYSSDGINFTASGQLDGLPAGPYPITAKDADGNTTQVTVTVGNVAGPTATATAIPATCRNDDGVISVAVTGGTSPFAYTVSHDGISSGTLKGLAAGDYLVTVADANSCVGITTTTVPLINRLTVDITPVAPVCEGVGLQLQAVSQASSFSWYPSAGLSNAGIANPVLSASFSQPYTVTATEGPCRVQNSVQVTVLPAPQAFVSPDITVCYGKNVTLSGSGGGSYSWTPVTYLDNPRSSNPTVVHPVSTISYALSVTGSNGCSTVRPLPVVVTVSPPAVLFPGNDTTVAIGQPLQLHAIDVNNTGFTTYSWYPADGLDNPEIADPVAVLHNNETYTVTAYSDAGCGGSGMVHVKAYAGPEIYVPNAFTPNGDGHNDVLKTIPAGIGQFHYFMLFDRYGQMVFSTADPSKGWNGTINGQLQPAGTFVWQAEGIDYEGNLVRRKGTVILIR